MDPLWLHILFLPLGGVKGGIKNWTPRSGEGVLLVSPKSRKVLSSMPNLVSCSSNVSVVT